MALPAKGLACLLLLCAGALLVAQPAHKKSLPRSQRHEYRHEIDHLEEDWRDAMVKGNTDALANLLSDDYTAITAMGVIQTKEETLASVRSGALQITSMNTSDRKIRLYGGTAVVTSVAEVNGTHNDQEMTGRYRYTRVYARNASGQWKIVSFEASRIQEPSEHK
jgi:ketosteroid isomerase-like protein